MTLPDSLPDKPEGWTRKMLLHMNFGKEGGAARFSIYDPDGTEMPFGYQYDTRKGGLTGFTAPGIDDVMTWAELRERWPEIRAAKADAAALAQIEQERSDG